MDSNRELERFAVNEDSATVGARWKKWMRAFDLYLRVKAVEGPGLKQAQLLHMAGSEVQDVFYALDVVVPDNGDAYELTKEALGNHFSPQINVPYERHEFRSLAQQSDEAVGRYVIRLRQKAEYCEFGNKKDEMIRDQIIEKCNSIELRRQLLKEGTTLTLRRAMEIARLWEMSCRQAQVMESIEAKTEQVYRVERRQSEAKNSRNSSATNNETELRCFRCNHVGHFARDKICPARRSMCKGCGKEGHFQVVCKTKLRNEVRSQMEYKQRRVRQVEGGDSSREEDSSEERYVFSIRERCRVFGIAEEEMISVVLGGVRTEMIIDSGATCNIVDRECWERLKNSRIQCKSYPSRKVLYSYGSSQPLKILGAFTAKVQKSNGEPAVKAEVFVLNGSGGALLGKRTAMDLGLLSMGSGAVKAIGQQDFREEFKEIFGEIGKLKNFQLQIPIDPSVVPVAQPTRRLPFRLREAQRELISALLKEDIIERVEGPTPWVSPAHMVPKGNENWRLCVDMRRANQAVIRERYPIPTVEELLQNLDGSTSFSKLDLRWGYHQVELEERSREITTFTTEDGLFRYKRLMFGISCAPEMYHRIMTQVLQGCEGVEIFLDDVLVHGRSREEHDERLRKALQRLRERGLTLNMEKCQFRKENIVFLGHHISKKGITPTESSKETVGQFRHPRNSEEVRSFLGLVNFSGRFIPDLATRSEPLRKLTRKGVAFAWEEQQERAFEDLKKSIVEPTVLGFYNKEAKTIVIADASPVGLGAVLIQRQHEGPRVIRYASRTLSDVEKRYSQTEKEALALVWACEKFHLYLYGDDFELFTDHKPLEMIFSPRSKPCARIERWVLRLQSYRFRIVYTSGKSNIADPLSRLLDVKQVTRGNKFEEQIRRIIGESIPRSCSMGDIEKAAEDDEELQELRRCIETAIWTPEMKKYELIKEELSVVDGLIVRGTRIVVPKSLQQRILQLAHEGHLGIVGTKQRLRTKVWWKSLDRDVEQWVRTCHGCQITALPNPPEPMIRSELPEGPWEQVSVDYLGPLPSAHYLIVIVDYYSRYYEVEITKTMVAEDLIFRLRVIFARFGFPDILISDNGGTFRDEDFGKFLQECGVQHRYTTPLWPQANGEVERQNRSIMKRLRIAQAEGRPWKEELYTYLLAYRETPHTTTGIAPAQLMFGRRIRSKLPEIGRGRKLHLDEEMRDRDREKKEEGKRYADARRQARISPISRGDWVLVTQPKQNKLSTPFNPTPVKVIERTGNAVVFETPEGKQYKRNSSVLKRFAARECQQADTVPVESEELPESQLHAGIRSTPEKIPEIAVGSKGDDKSTREGRATRKPMWMEDYVINRLKRS